MKKIVSFKFIALAALAAKGRVPAHAPRLYAAEGIDAQALADLAETADGAVRDIELSLDRLKRDAESLRVDLDRGYFSWTRSVGSNALDVETSTARAKTVSEMFARMFDAMFGLHMQSARVIAGAHVSDDANTDSSYASASVVAEVAGALNLAIAMKEDHDARIKAEKDAAEAARIKEAEEKKAAKLAARRNARKAVAS